jgi:hypothetical protein
MIAADDLRAHALSFCEAHGIAVYWVKRPSQAHALHEAEQIHIAPIKSAISYATALHEIGHVLGRHQRSKHVLVRERWAWEWARRNARCWTPAMERCAISSLSWYGRRLLELRY